MSEAIGCVQAFATAALTSPLGLSELAVALAATLALAAVAANGVAPRGRPGRGPSRRV